MVSNVNMPNNFLTDSNLQKEAVVETNAVFSRDSIRAVAWSLPEPIRELILPHVQNHGYILRGSRWLRSIRGEGIL